MFLVILKASTRSYEQLNWLLTSIKMVGFHSVCNELSLSKGKTKNYYAI